MFSSKETSNYWHQNKKVKSLSRVRLLATPWTVAARLLCPQGFPGKNTGVSCIPPPGNLLDPGIELMIPVLQADSYQLSHREAPVSLLTYLKSHHEETIQHSPPGEVAQKHLMIDRQMSVSASSHSHMQT